MLGRLRGASDNLPADATAKRAAKLLRYTSMTTCCKFCRATLEAKTGKAAARWLGEGQQLQRQWAEQGGRRVRGQATAVSAGPARAHVPVVSIRAHRELREGLRAY